MNRIQLRQANALAVGEFPLEGEPIWDSSTRRLGFYDFPHQRYTWFRIPGVEENDNYTPEHRWIDSSLSFIAPDGTWGPAIELRGPAGVNPYTVWDENVVYPSHSVLYHNGSLWLSQVETRDEPSAESDDWFPWFTIPEDVTSALVLAETALGDLTTQTENAETQLYLFEQLVESTAANATVVKDIRIQLTNLNATTLTQLTDLLASARVENDLVHAALAEIQRDVENKAQQTFDANEAAAASIEDANSTLANTTAVLEQANVAYSTVNSKVAQVTADRTLVAQYTTQVANHRQYVQDTRPLIAADAASARQDRQLAQQAAIDAQSTAGLENYYNKSEVDALLVGFEVEEKIDFVEASTAPMDPLDGFRWLDTTSGIVYTWLASSDQWVEV